MKILTDLCELHYLTGIMELYNNHKEVFNACLHEQGRASGYVRLRNYLRTTGEWAKGEVDFDHIWVHMQVNEEDIALYQSKFPGMSDVQAGLITMMDAALACNSVFEVNSYHPVTNLQIKMFIKELFDFIRPIEEYLPDDIVQRLHERFAKPLLLKEDKYNYKSKPNISTLFKLTPEDGASREKVERIEPEDYENYRFG